MKRLRHSRFLLVFVCAAGVAFAGCSSSSDDKATGAAKPQAGQNSKSSSTPPDASTDPDGGSNSGGSNSGGSSPSSSSSDEDKNFCNEYSRLMGSLMQDSDEKVEAEFASFLRTAPPTFKSWAEEVIPWADAVVSDNSEQINATVEASEEGEYQIMNKCQFVLAE